ncbi:hypothetical protein [Polyangium jinanense]|uniref:Uncharacterized protein n=1 Tax=Polyangium jinanense TaxID=2829994 RepID=A0A9X3X3G7_9BACT|nr:hypothetical protein [Polyangium jinanense]MDC3983544.1 hypothetical protein [Polyangium jinanense]
MMFLLGLGAALGALGCGSDEVPEPSGAKPPEPPATTDAGPGGEEAACAPLGETVVVSQEDGTTPSILWANGSYLVAWQTLTGGTDEVRVARIGTDGSVSPAHVVATLAGSHAVPSLQATSSGPMIAWEDVGPSGLVIQALALGADGTPTGQPIQLGTSDATEARAATAPMSGGLAVAWMETPGVRLGLVSSGGMSSTTALPGARFPALASRGNELAVAWSTGAELSIARTTGMPGSSVTGTVVRTGAGEARLPSVAIDASGASLVAWEDTREGAERIYLVRAAASGAKQGEVRVEDAEGSANWPIVTVLGERTAVTYYQFQGGPPSIFLSVFGPDLARDGATLRVSGKNARYPAVAFSGSELGVAWAEKDAGIRMRRVGCD